MSGDDFTVHFQKKKQAAVKFVELSLASLTAKTLQKRLVWPIFLLSNIVP